jgi:hypothetical protein
LCVATQQDPRRAGQALADDHEDVSTDLASNGGDALVDFFAACERLEARLHV